MSATGGEGLGPEVRPEEISALADGLLPPRRAAQIEARAAASPELEQRIAVERRAVSALRAAAVDAGGAPAGLRARVEATRRPAPRRRLLFGGAAMAAAVLAALAAFLLLPTGSGGPTIAAALERSAGPAEGPAPRSAPGSPALLDLSVDGVAFPSWSGEFGWSDTGRRDDRPSGRSMTTVLYEKNAETIRYAIISGDPLDPPAGATRIVRDGVELHAFDAEGRTAVTWLRDGRTCLLSSDGGVDRATLIKLAVWKGSGAVVF